MITLKSLTNYLDNYLHFDNKMDITVIDPYMTNGLMISGNKEVKTIGFGVSASMALFEKALKERCNAIIVHHSFNIPPVNRYDAIFQERIGFLIKNDISLFGYHFLLDAHPKVGNNSELLNYIGAHPTIPYLFHHEPWGWIGIFESTVPFPEIIARLKTKLSPRMTVYPYGNKRIKNVVALSGKGAPYAGEMQNLIEKNIDLYITGEVHEWNRELFREAHIHCIAGGHYHTEVFGITALMKKIKITFPEITVKWLDLENEV